MPDPDPTYIERKTAQIKRINDLSELARTAWFSLLAYLVFVGITLLGVEDADFFLASRRTQLPLVGVEIPTASFFWTAPVLGAALYTYLHLFLIKLWDAHGDAPTSDADPTHHWLVNDFVLIRQGDPTARARPLAWLTSLITFLLVWIAGPLVLGYAWWRSMPAHSEWMTLLIAACFGVTLFVGVTSWWSADARLRPWRTRWGRRWHKWAAVTLGAVLLAVTSWLRTEGGLDHYIPRPWAPTLQDVTVTVDANTPVLRWWLEQDLVLPLARTDLADEALGSPPDTWREPDYARRRYREEWCARRDIDLWTCESFGNADDPGAADIQSAWCNKQAIAGEACPSRFEALASAFREEWQQERYAYLSQLDDPDQVGRDLRRANLRNAFLADADLLMARLEGADLRAARLEGADLFGALLEGANLSLARLEGADLRGARLEGANLGGARLDGAILRGARMDGANLSGARMEGADLVGARLEGANLNGAGLKGADLFGARLEGAHFIFAQLEGANLSYADSRNSNWAGASIRASLALFADLRGAQGLMQSQLEDWIGNARTLLPDGAAPDTGKPYFVWSCWETPPPDLDRIVATAASQHALSAEFLCGPGNPRRKLETGLALDAPYPAGHPLAGRD